MRFLILLILISGCGNNQVDDNREKHPKSTDNGPISAPTEEIWTSPCDKGISETLTINMGFVAIDYLKYDEDACLKLNHKITVFGDLSEISNGKGKISLHNGEIKEFVLDKDPEVLFMDGLKFNKRNVQ